MTRTITLYWIVGSVIVALVGCPASRQQQQQEAATPETQGSPADTKPSPTSDTPKAAASPDTPKTPSATGRAEKTKPQKAEQREPSTEVPKPQAAPANAAPTAAKRPRGRWASGLRRRLSKVKAPCTGARAGGPAVICVDDNSSGKKGTAAAPFSTIRAALKVAKKGDTIQVAAGTYKENVAIKKPSIKLLGGFAADFASRQPSKQKTTIKGVGRDAVVVIDGSGAVVDGFRVTGGTGNERQKRWFYAGGGFFVTNASATISYNLIEHNDIVTSHRDNNEENLGGGIFAEHATVKIIGNVVRKNKTSRGAIAVAHSRARIQGNSVTDNLAIGDHGGGMYLAGPRIEVLDNYVARNRLVPKQGHGGWGGGVMVLNKGTRATLKNNIVTGNRAPANGSGVFIDDGAVATLQNELIYNNACNEGGGAGLYVDGLDRRVISRATVINCTIAANRCPGKRGVALFAERAQVTVSNSILWGNGGDDIFADRYSKVRISYSITEEKISGKGNKRKDPLFVDTKRGDFHLRSRAGRWHRSSRRWVTDETDSPGIDAGDPKGGAGKEQQPNGNRRNVGTYGGTTAASLTPSR